MGKNILTGLRANGELHLGNYLGSIKPMVELQRSLKADDKFFMFVPDLHTFTVPIDHDTLYQNVIDNVRAFIAAGIDPQDSSTILYRQSRIPAHSELAWILDCFTYFGEASRMTEFKDKSDKLGHKSITVGLFNYPVLMAGDMLLYDANYIPLGDDQKQHLELTRDLAERMNNKFGELFTVPETWEKQVEFSGRELSVRIRSLSRPEQKMSKSVDDPRGTVNLSDDPEEAAKKVLAATTDSVGRINFDFDTQPGISNLLQIAYLLGDTSLDEVKQKWVGQENYGELKKHVAGLVKDFLAGFQANLAKIDAAEVETVLESGEQQAAAIAEKKLLKVQKAIGLRR